jgi:lactate permease
VDVPLPVVLLAALPLAALAVLVLATRVGLGTAAWSVAAASALLALTVFGMTPIGVVLGAAKGGWTGLWILALVAPALLLFGVAESAGALDRLTDALQPLAPTPGRRLLLLAWVLPSFLQGVAGFGLPIVVAAPMLVRTGVPPVAAVAACMVGYQWSVTFGSMGSSFFVAAGTTQLDAADTGAFALKAAALLVVNLVVAGLLVLRRGDGRSPGTAEAVPAALAIALVMGVVLVGVVGVQPALGSTTAGLAGLLAAAALLPRRGVRPPVRPILVAAAPYLLLTALVVVVVGLPPLRGLAEQVGVLAPAFPDTTAAYGHYNAPVFAHQPFRPLLHPGLYLLLAAGAGAVLYRRLGWRGGGPRAVFRAWAARAGRTATSLLGLTVLAGVLVDSGMLAALAGALTDLLGPAYTAVAPVVGATGTIMTGSTTASNALLAPLQAGAAGRLGVDATTLLAAQTAGGNVGNALAPVNALVAAAAVGVAGQEGAILRRAARDALPLLALTAAGVVVLALLPAPWLP